MLNIGPQELLLILVVALIVVGPHRLPELGRALGRGLRELRKAQEEVRKTINVTLDEPPPQPARRDRARAAGASTEPAEGGKDADEGALETGTASADDGGAREISRTLGRSLAELRRAREEIQRTFRVDLDEPAPAPPPTRPRPDARAEPDPAEGGPEVEGPSPPGGDEAAG